LQTRSSKLYSSASIISGNLNIGSFSNSYNYTAYQSSSGNPWYPGFTGSVLAFTVDSFNPINGQLQAWSGDTRSGSAVTMSVTSGSLKPIKAGGPNYDAIQTNGATMSFSLVGSPSGSRSGTPLFQTNSIQDGGLQQWAANQGVPDGTGPYDPAYNAVPAFEIIGNAQNFPCALGTLCNEQHMRSWTTSVGLISGSLTITGVEGYKVKYTATTSSSGNQICMISGGVEYPQGFPNGTNTKDKVIGTTGITSLSGYSGGYAGIGWTLGSSLLPITSSVAASPARSSIGNQVTIETSPDCVFRTITFGQTYNATLYNQQYGGNG
jgi:hypothetical protein